MAHPVRSTGRQCNLNSRTPFLHPLTASTMQKNLFTVSVSAREQGEQIAEALVGAVFNRFLPGSLPGKILNYRASAPERQHFGRG